jgi:hypothetical protein
MIVFDEFNRLASTRLGPITILENPKKQRTKSGYSGFRPGFQNGTSLT